MVRNLNKNLLLIGLGPILQNFIDKRIFSKIDIISNQSYIGKNANVTSYLNYQEIDFRNVDLVIVGVRYERLNAFSKNLLNLILFELTKPDCRAQIIVLSSVAVYGDSLEVCDENYLRLGQTEYASGKIELENSIIRTFDSSRFNILRISNIYGVFAQNDVVNSILTSLLTDREVKLPTEDNFRDFIYLKDFLEILDSLVINPTNFPSILNVGTGVSVSIYQLCSILTTLIDKDFETTFLKKVIKSQHINSFIDVKLLKLFYSKPLSTLDASLGAYVPEYQKFLFSPERVH